MSWETINLILGLAAVEPEFFRELQTNLNGVVSKYELDLTTYELTSLHHIEASDLAEFSQQVIDLLQPRED